MTAPTGGFYSAEEADSEGEEGKFYLWTLQEIQHVLSADLADFATKIFDIRAEGNYYETHKGLNGKNILHLAVPLDQMANNTDLTLDQVRAKLDRVSQLLFLEREKRVHPY